MFIFATDYHGIEADKRATEAFFKSLDLLDPQRKARRIMGGDLWNFAALRRGADEDEKRHRLKEDFYAGITFLERYRPDDLLLGNHDQRLWDAVKRERVRKSGWLAEYAEELIAKFEQTALALGIRVKPYDKAKGILRVDKLAFAHGYGHGETLTSNMADAYGDVVFGHGHKIVRDTSMKGAVATGYQIGCLARKDMDYVRAELSALRQQHGFAFGDTKRALVVQVEIRDGVALLPPTF